MGDSRSLLLTLLLEEGLRQWLKPPSFFRFFHSPCPFPHSVRKSESRTVEGPAAGYQSQPSMEPSDMLLQGAQDLCVFVDLF